MEDAIQQLVDLVNWSEISFIFFIYFSLLLVSLCVGSDKRSSQKSLVCKLFYDNNITRELQS
jgi:hypothetical protein